jgi:hypothetical protein
MTKKLRATRISDRLPHISKNELTCYEPHEGQNGILEHWFCPYFEGRINRAPMESQWGRCHLLGVTETMSTHSFALLWEGIKHPNCPEPPFFVSSPKT